MLVFVYRNFICYYCCFSISVLMKAVLCEMDFDIASDMQTNIFFKFASLLFVIQISYVIHKSSIYLLSW